MSEVAEKSNRSHYEADLEALRGLNGPEWLRDLRKTGADRFARSEFPHHKEEAWRFTNVAPIVKTPFRSVVAKPFRTVTPDEVAPHLYDEPDWTQLVFVDGFLSKALSRMATLPKGLRVGSIAEAAAGDDATARAHLNNAVEHSNAFISLNTAFLQDGAFLCVPKNTVLDTPIHVLFVSTGAGGKATHPRSLFVIESSSEATLLETHVGLSAEGYLSNGVTEIIVEDNARLKHHRVVNEGVQGFHLSTAKMRLGRDAFIESFVMTLGGKIVRNELCALFDGEGGECVLNGLYLNGGDRLIDNALFVEHAKSHCRSRMSYKGVLDGASNAVFTGKVLVRRDAQRTDSDQLNSNLLLSAHATIDTKPQLEIFADDVKCTHGAAVGSFPDELLFYFRSRGMSREMAHGMLTYGFAQEIVAQIGVAPLRERLAKHVFDQYSPE